MNAGPTEHRDFERFLGVDLGGGKGKNTALALLQRDGDHVRVCFVGTKSAAGRPFYDDELVRTIEEYRQGGLVAVDAPLTLPVCVRCRLARCVGLERCADPVIDWIRGPGRTLVVGEGCGNSGKPAITPYTQRVCEVLLHRRHGILPRETLGQGMGPLTARGHYLRRALEESFSVNVNLIEVYPKATLHKLFGAEYAHHYKGRVDTWRTRATMLEALSDRLRFDVWREGCLSNDHCFDAVVCAYTGYLWATEGWTLSAADLELLRLDGWIWFPPDDRVAPPGD